MVLNGIEIGIAIGIEMALEFGIIIGIGIGIRNDIVIVVAKVIGARLKQHWLGLKQHCDLDRRIGIVMALELGLEMTAFSFLWKNTKPNITITKKTKL